jgi:hydrogenase nickel incorporation protein HypA/HybF
MLIHIKCMHEIRIAKDLSDIVLEVAGRENLSVVSRVNISFGEMIQIVPDIFDFAFREAVRDSIASDAHVDIEIIHVRLKCKKCSNEFGLSDNLFSCKKCNSEDIDIIAGKEMFIKSLEGE